MRIDLDSSLYAFTVPPGAAVTLEVLAGELGFSYKPSGPFFPDGTLTAGQRREFDRPVVVAANGRASFDLAYPQPEHSEAPAPGQEEPPGYPDSEPANGAGRGEESA